MVPGCPLSFFQKFTVIITKCSGSTTKPATDSLVWIQKQCPGGLNQTYVTTAP